MNNWQRTLQWFTGKQWITRGGLGYFVMGLIVLCGAAWSFGALVEIGNIAAKGEKGGVGPLTTLQPPVAGFLFAGSVDLFIFYGYLKCYGPTWQISLSVFHILVGLATSVGFQLAHALGHVDPVAVSVVPPIAVALSLDTWVVSQWIDWRQRSKKVEAPGHLTVSVASAPTAAATEAGPTPHPPRPRPVATTLELDNKHIVAFRRAYQNAELKQPGSGPAAVEQVRAERDIDPALVPARWNGHRT